MGNGFGSGWLGLGKYGIKNMNNIPDEYVMACELVLDPGESFIGVGSWGSKAIDRAFFLQQTFILALVV